MCCFISRKKEPLIETLGEEFDSLLYDYIDYEDFVQDNLHLFPRGTEYDISIIPTKMGKVKIVLKIPRLFYNHFKKPPIIFINKFGRENIKLEKK